MDMLVSFNTASLFPKVPVERHFAVALTACIRHVLATIYFLCNSSFYDQRGSIAIGSPLTPVRAHFYMESFKLEAISSATKKPEHWYRYTYNTFAVWTQGKEGHQGFRQHLNNIHANIKFIMEMQ
jgi:hypothetical protein